VERNSATADDPLVLDILPPLFGARDNRHRYDAFLFRVRAVIAKFLPAAIFSGDMRQTRMFTARNDGGQGRS
jgi:hypothetical protein